ncbi:hypothetical protein MSAN_00843000 [Mycena sanguinolenta]|uniref:Bacteriophage T5 Orf172 DNA-binding domain-containing protein n=1 Tax=Mycena sanguinolenta TaxID=230812 RepID=A0A8H6YVC1_9AGAR|nr:hypothetical protein MSAN_00843000 [Mycena sanguinolenta]
MGLRIGSIGSRIHAGPTCGVEVRPAVLVPTEIRDSVPWPYFEGEARRVGLAFSFTAPRISSPFSLFIRHRRTTYLCFLLHCTSLSTTLLTALVVVSEVTFCVFQASSLAPTAITTYPPPLNVVVGVDVRDSPLLACRLTSSTSSRRLAHPVDQQMALLALDHPYVDDGPGELYVQGRRNPNGQLEFKVGETSSMPRRYGEYSKCTKNGHTLQWEFHCEVPYRKLAERLVHLSFRALGGVLVRYPCPGCYVRHREFYLLDNIGDLDAVVRVLSFWVVAIGGTFERVDF